MPRYKVVERRALYSGVIIDAATEEAAGRYDGRVLDEAETDTWGDELLSVAQVADDCDAVGMLP